MSDAPRPTLVMASYWTGETEYVAGIGDSRDSAYECLIRNPDIDTFLRAKIEKNREIVSYQDVVPCTFGWTTTSSD